MRESKKNFLKALRPLLFAVVVLLFAAFGWKEGKNILIFLPGTQPGHTTEAESVGSCKPCHEDQVRDWSGSMMAHAPKDPLFNALLSITSKYTMHLGLDVGEYCLRCHTPSGWLAGRSHPGTVKELYGTDLDGIHCDFCHRSMDPLHPDTSAIVGDSVPGYGNAMYAVQKYNQPLRGSRGIAVHRKPTQQESFFRQSEFCGVCHDVSNPYLSPNARHTPPHLQVPVERTYSEWKLSWYAGQGEGGTCQSCHMQRLPGYGSSLPGSRYRLDVARHDFTGGNILSPRAVLGSWTGVNAAAIKDGTERSVLILSKAAKLEVIAGHANDSVVVLVRIINLTGHKLPTGFPEGRQLWLSVVGRNKNGDITFESGKYDTTSGELIHDTQMKKYEITPGVSFTLAAALGLSPGPSFLAAFNDTTYFDNRIPPRGFNLAAFRERRAEPVGYHYEDGQYSDVAKYIMSRETDSVEVSVFYQVINKELAEFLRDQNVGNPYDWNDWGSKVYSAWRSFGGPVRIAHAMVGVQPTPPQLLPFSDVELPFEIRLAQNYPNPFNGRSTIEFWISERGRTSITLYDIAGREVEKVIETDLPAGLHTASIDGSNLASGVYFYRLEATSVADASMHFSQVKKMLLMR